MSSSAVNTAFIDRPLLEKALGTKIGGFRRKSIRGGLFSRSVFRIWIEPINGAGPVETLIAKSGHVVKNGPEWARDREALFYSEIFPLLELPRPELYLTEIDESTGERWMFMEDLAPRYRFPASSEKLNWDELKQALRTYARLHHGGAAHLPEKAERSWLFSYLEPDWKPGALLEMFDSLVASGHWDANRRLAPLITIVLDALPDLIDGPLTFVHHDVWPSNMGFPRYEDTPVALIDWEMAGWGMEEIDLAYLFMSPYQNVGHIDRAQALDFYWSERKNLETSSISGRDLKRRQDLADALLILNLLPVAYGAIQQPYPTGSGPKRYWDAMHGVLNENVQALCRRL